MVRINTNRLRSKNLWSMLTIDITKTKPKADSCPDPSPSTSAFRSQRQQSLSAAAASAAAVVHSSRCVSVLSDALVISTNNR